MSNPQPSTLNTQHSTLNIQHSTLQRPKNLNTMHFSAPFIFVLACASSAIAACHQITVTDKGFEPAQVCIDTGDTIDWYFAAGGHSVQESVAPGSCDSKNTWRSSVMQAGWGWNRSFKTPGVVSYMSFVGNDCANGFKGAIYVGVSCPTTNETPKTSVQPETPAPSKAPVNPEANTDTIEVKDAKTNSATSEHASMALAAAAAVVAAVMTM